MSKYDQITTAADLIFEVRAHGLSTIQADICRAQDIIGNSTIEELEALATDTGRADDNGNPSQFGNWSTGRDGTQKFFYSIIFSIWNWEDATAFYNRVSNQAYMEGRQAVEKVRKLEKDMDRLTSEKQNADTIAASAEARISDLESKLEKLEAQLRAKDEEIIHLKAKMYDLLTSQAV